MNEALLVSNVLLWCLVIALAIIVVALARQVGILHERVAPAGALMPTNGPKVGELTTGQALVDLDGRPLTIGGANADGAATLVLWVSPTCPVCRALVPTAVSLAKRERMRLVFASDGENVDQHRRYVADLGIGRYPYVVSQTLGMAFAVSKLPFAALIAPDGTLASKGLVNTREHLESLVESMSSGIASLQDYMRRADAAERPVQENVV
ncbi:MAG TPA: methylamine dehydrogenase accessory protein MauD [Woeseiaceae bacterium]|nr:methylamine dehydrogenase accessory protein MauD [Woeseiaceae bacterium]